MAMIVETGEGLENADTFISPADTAARVAEEASYPLLAGLTEAELEPHLRSAFRWMKTENEENITGLPRNDRQTGLFPRCGARTAWRYVGAGEIPREIIDAQLAAAEASAEGTSLFVKPRGGGIAYAQGILRRYHTRR